MQSAKSKVASHPQRKKIVEQLIAGVPVRDIAGWTNPPVSHNAINNYKLKVVIPSMELTASMANHVSTKTVDSDLVQRVVTASPVRERLEWLWSKTKGFVDESKVDNAAPLLNSARSQLELNAKLSGELADKSNGPNLTITIALGQEIKRRVDLSDDGSEAIESK